MSRLTRRGGELLDIPGGDAASSGTSSASSTRWKAAGLLAAAALAASYLVVRSKTRQAEAENPPQGKFITVDGVRLHYLEQGQGQPIVLLHGNGTTAEDYRLSGLLGQLAGDYRVIVFDRPGFGYSERPRSTVWTPAAQARLLQQALQRLQVESPVLVGHSWGTMVALAMALDHPRYVRGLVLLSGYYYPSLRLDVVASSGPAIPLLGDLLRYTLSPLLGRLVWPAVVRRAFSPSKIAESFKRLPKWMALRPSQLRAAAAEAALMIPSAAALRRRYPELTMPVAIVAGDGDLVADTGHNAQRLHDQLPQSDLKIVSDAGHMVHYEAQAEIVASIRRVAERRAPDSPRGGASQRAPEPIYAEGSHTLH